MSDRPRTLFEKIWDRHVVPGSGGEGLPSLLSIDLHLVHEVTSPQAFAELDRRGLKVRAPEIVHDLPAGGRRFMQRARGYERTLVAGVDVIRHDEITGELPGRLIRA